MRARLVTPAVAEVEPCRARRSPARPSSPKLQQVSYAHLQVSDEEIDSTSTTPLQRYVAALPQGLDSYPQHTIKAAFARTLLDELSEPPRDLPGPIGALVDSPPVISARIPEVHHQALLLGVEEQVFDGNTSAFLDSMLHMQRRLLNRKIYAPLLQLVDAPRLFKYAARRWNNFHRGTTLQVVNIISNEARISISHPQGLFSSLGREALAGGFRVAIEAGRSHEAEVVVIEASDERTDFRGRWS